MRSGMASLYEGGSHTTDVTIRPVDGGFIVEWFELRERELPPSRLEAPGESWKSEGRKRKVPVTKQAVREKLSAALELMETIVKKHVERLKKGDDEGVDPLEFA